ncbi:right-handed parallel beta-helix repeat-containing protein [Bacteroidota bacterium]
MKTIKSICVIILQIVFCTSLSAATYYVSPSGSNSNSGTGVNMPYKTVQFAVNQMSEGDTLIVLDGYYLGTLEMKSGITIQAQNPRNAVFSGAVPLTSEFVPHTDKVYKTRVDIDIKQLFFNNQPMTWARWPNARWSDNWIEDKKWAFAAKGTGPGVLTSEQFDAVADLDLVGAYCFLRYGKGNSCYSRLIEAFDGDTLHWNDNDFYTNTFTGEDGWRGTASALRNLAESHVYHPINSKFFLAGDIDLLDAPGEWFVEDGFLYFYPPEGINPNEGVILAKTIDYCIDQEEDVSDVTIEGVDFLGGSVRLGSPGNKNISFYNSHFLYQGGELLFIDRVKGRRNNKPVEIQGSGISFEKCLFAGAHNSALTISGEEITVQNCVFIENNRHANFESRPLSMRAKGYYKITRNTFFNNCSDAITIGLDLRDYTSSKSPEVSYNNIFNAGIYNSDVSGVYMPTKSQKYTEVHHNWMHNVKGNALRLDVAGKELNVHHNVFWQSKRGMSIEGYGQFNIYNNTDVYNHVPTDLIRNVLNHTGARDASFDSTFTPIDNWNVINNIVEAFSDRVGPREKNLFAAQYNRGLTNPERPDAPTGDIPVKNRGAIQGNFIGDYSHVFANGNLEGLNLVPDDKQVKDGVEPDNSLKEQGVLYLDTFRGAYDVNGEDWYPGSDWMPYKLEVIKTMAEAEKFAKKYHSISIVPIIYASDLPLGEL